MDNLVSSNADNIKEEPMDRYSPVNMSSDENDPETCSEVPKKSQSQSQKSSIDGHSDNEQSKKSQIKSNLSKEKSTKNRIILKRKKRKFDWEVLILNKDLKGTDLNYENKGFKLTLSNFPTHWGEEELKDFILKVNGPIDYFYMSIDKQYFFVGSVQLHFSTKEKWKEAWDKFNGKWADDQRIFAHIDDFTDSDGEPEEPPVKRFKDTVDSEENKVKSDVDVWETDPKGLYGLKPEFLESLGIVPPIDKWVQVNNVRCDKSELKEIMELAGEVLICNILCVGNLKYAKVMYSHPLEAVQAVSMLNNQELYGAKLKVTMDPSENDTQLLPKGLKSVGPGLGVMGIHLRDIVRQYERYVKGFNSGINTSVFLGVDGQNYTKTHPKPINSMMRHNVNVNPMPRVSFNTNNYMPNNMMGPYAQNMCPMRPGVMPMGQMRPMGPMQTGPICPPRQFGPMNGPNMPMNNRPPVGPVMGPNVGPNLGPVMGPVPAPAPVPRPSNIIVVNRVGSSVGNSPTGSPSPSLSSPQSSNTVELCNLPLSTTFPLLCDKMSQCGAVMSLQLGAPGTAVVQFANRVAAEKCYSILFTTTYDRMGFSTRCLWLYS